MRGSRVRGSARRAGPITGVRDLELADGDLSRSKMWMLSMLKAIGIWSSMRALVRGSTRAMNCLSPATR
jgi:hypothetical protein